jgi:DNA-binding LacI/PurR family transcriptional regulator
MAIEHLVELGHRRIAHLAGPYEACYRFPFGAEDRTIRTLERAESVSRARLDGAIQVLEEQSLHDAELFSEAHPWKHADIRPSMERWSKMVNPPTAIYCANDYIAWEAILWARTQGIRVPNEIAIVGVDNVEGPDRELFLSSVDIDVEEIGRRAMHVILDVLSGAESTSTHQIVEPLGLIARGSSSPSYGFSQDRGHFDRAARGVSEDR